MRRPPCLTRCGWPTGPARGAQVCAGGHIKAWPSHWTGMTNEPEPSRTPAARSASSMTLSGGANQNEHANFSGEIRNYVCFEGSCLVVSLTREIADSERQLSRAWYPGCNSVPPVLYRASRGNLGDKAIRRDTESVFRRSSSRSPSGVAVVWLIGPTRNVDVYNRRCALRERCIG